MPKDTFQKSTPKRDLDLASRQDLNNAEARILNAIRVSHVGDLLPMLLTLRDSNDKLQCALDRAGKFSVGVLVQPSDKTNNGPLGEHKNMPNEALLESLRLEVERAVTVETGAAAVINGFGAR